MGGGGGLGIVGGLVIVEGEARVPRVDAVNEAFDFKPFEDHFKSLLGGADFGGAVDFEVFGLTVHKSLEATFEGFLLEAKREGGLFPVTPLKIFRDAGFQFAGERFSVERIR